RALTSPPPASEAQRRGGPASEASRGVGPCFQMRERASHPRSPTASRGEGSGEAPLRNIARRASPPLPLRLDRLVTHEIPNLINLLDKKLALENIRIVLVETRLNDRLDAAG